MLTKRLNNFGYIGWMSIIRLKSRASSIEATRSSKLAGIRLSYQTITYIPNGNNHGRMAHVGFNGLADLVYLPTSNFSGFCPAEVLISL